MKINWMLRRRVGPIVQSARGVVLVVVGALSVHTVVCGIVVREASCVRGVVLGFVRIGSKQARQGPIRGWGGAMLGQEAVQCEITQKTLTKKDNIRFA